MKSNEGIYFYGKKNNGDLGISGLKRIYVGYNEGSFKKICRDKMKIRRMREYLFNCKSQVKIGILNFRVWDSIGEKE